MFHKINAQIQQLTEYSALLCERFISYLHCSCVQTRITPTLILLIHVLSHDNYELVNRLEGKEAYVSWKKFQDLAGT